MSDRNTENRMKYPVEDIGEILVVEDSLTQAELLKFLLEKYGYQISVASNGREALDMINKSKPAIVISDIVMPEMDGYELCRCIKADEKLKDIPVILLTSLSDSKDVLKGLECGADNFITKPYDEKYILSRVQYILANSQIRERDKMEMGIKMFFGGQEYYITAARQQILDLLISTYETALQKNIELQKVQDELRLLNENLEKKVEKRTASLRAEIKVRRLGETLLSESEEQHRRLVEFSPYGIFLHNKGKIVYVNLTGAKILGRENPDEFIGKTVFQIIHPDYHKIVKNRIRMQVEGKVVPPLEEKFLRIDGISVDVEIASIPFIYKGEQTIYGVFRDITERKKAEEALKKSETSLKMAQEQGKIGSWEFDLKTQKINWSDQVYVLYERDKKLGPPSAEEEAQYYLPEVTEKLHEFARMATETGKEYRYDLTVRLPGERIAFFNTSINPVKDEYGNVIQLLGTVQDITERKKAEENTQMQIMRISALHSIDLKMLSNVSIEDILKIVIQYVPKELIGDVVAISIPEENLFVSRLPSGQIINERVLKVSQKMDESFESQKETIAVHDLASEPRVQILSERLQNINFVSYLGVPMVIQDRTIGVMHLLNRNSKDFAKDDIEFFKTLAGQAAIAYERLKGIKALRDNEERLIFALEAADLGTFDLDITTGIAAHSPRHDQCFGYREPVPDWTFDTAMKHMLPEDLPLILEAHACAEKTGVFSYEGRVVWPDDGSIHWIAPRGTVHYDSEGRPVRLIGVVADITKRKTAEENLKESEEKNRLLIDFSPYGIVNHIEGIITFINLQAAKILGAPSPEELIGKQVLSIVHPDYHNAAKERLLKEDDGKIALTIEEKFLRMDGTPVDVEIVSIPVNIRGKIYKYSVFSDITERKKAEETHLENLRLEAADKTKSEFLANMSHELRTPLNASIGFSELLAMGMAGELSEKQKQYVEIILTSNQFLLTLINDILDLSKIEAGKIDLVIDKMSVPETIKETLTLIKEKAMRHKVLLKTEFDQELEFIEADKQRFKQILFNLLSNAVKFSKKEGGTVTITVKKEGDMAKISVSDTGIGIKEENIGKLFHKFEQLESGISQKYGGTGLGLAITKQLVELHGGRIWAESKYGEGSTFTFTLPLEVKKEENK